METYLNFKQTFHFPVPLCSINTELLPKLNVVLNHIITFNKLTKSKTVQSIFYCLKLGGIQTKQ